jgi:Xaa-Pro dipeptidase
MPFTVTEQTVPKSEYGERLERLRDGMALSEWQAVYVASPANIRYLTGFAITPFERLAAVVVPRDTDPFIVVPALEAESAAENPAGMTVFSWKDQDGPFGLLRAALQQARVKGVALEKEAVNVTVFEALQAVLGEDSFADASAFMAQLRMRKSTAEVEAIAGAAAVLDACLAELPGSLRPGRAEAEVSFELDGLVRRHGGEGTAFETTVLSGPNAALPHGRPGARELSEGDLVIVDFGAVSDGYCADVTRTFAVGEPSDEAREIFELVRAAQVAGCEAVRAGALCSEVDAAARSVIDNGGYGDYFVHRTGHGLGLDVHEPPSLVAGNDRPLEVGNVVTVEPGIYVPGLLGVRIEDDVAVTESGGSTRLTNARRELIVCPV